jgi:hypothetical protein
MGRLLSALVVVALALSLGPSPASSAAASSAADPMLPPTGTDVDYQLGGSSRLPAHVGIVVRDREASPSPRAYSVCYVNGFQTQPHEKRLWRKHPRLVLRQHGRPVVDEAWGEWLLDIRTPAKRRALAQIMDRWMTGCAEDGFEAVELDNLDSFTRSHRLLSGADARRYAALLVRRAHAVGLAVAQKNRAGWDGTAVGFDFAVAEECGRWRECGAYVRVYGAQVLVVEYRRKDFRRTCRRWGDTLPVVLRDRALSPRGVHAWC